MTENILADTDKKVLLKIARDTIEGYARSGKKPPLPADLPPSLRGRQGAFVTVHHRGQLRGCIGTFFGEGELASTVRNMAYAAGWEDPRFEHLTAEELPDTDLEISVLSPLHEISDVNEILVGKHGIFITKGYYRGVLLPQVATEQGWDRDTFLSHTCIKAGLRPDAWKKEELKIEIFAAEVFGEKEFA
ncbi:MAG TPA: AmmeMemoRadiSam system protein A [bacterium]|nr:AmmeMemoRadiSam system protein A [bacterium]